MSSNTEEMEQKKKSQAIDRILEEDSKKLRRECKILLLGTIRLTSILSLHRVCDG
jgi:guanine nucleotide-binding protein subunit alpha